MSGESAEEDPATKDIAFRPVAGSGNHTVQTGETTDYLAEINGLFWETLWNAPENAEIRSVRDDRNVLLVGDKVFIPEKRPKSTTRSTDLIHSFVRKGVPARLRLRALAPDDTPLSACDYILRVGKRRYEGKTGNDGMIDQAVSPSAKTGVLIVFPARDDLPSKLEWEVTLGSLQPTDTVLGIQARLRNLGYNLGTLDNDLGAKTRVAIMQFRRANGLPDGSFADQEFVDALKDKHGS